MYVTIVDVYVMENHVTEFIEACRLNHEASIMESGNRRFDILQQTDKPGHFVLYEAYATEPDAIAHKQTAHYLAWRDTVASWMASPRTGTVYSGIFPA